MQAVLIQKDIWASSKEGLDLQDLISLKVQEPVQGALTCSTAGARAASGCTLRSSVDGFWQEYIRTYSRALDRVFGEELKFEPSWLERLLASD
ncbi:hypothetical protein ABBQ38_002501 [Trebouxia sp. C0009 RCD-2024]